MFVFFSSYLFNLSCYIYWHKVVCNVFLHFEEYVVMSPLSILIFLICVLFFLISLSRGISILSMPSKKQFLVSLTFFLSPTAPCFISLFSVLIFIIPFVLFILCLVYYYISDFFIWKRTSLIEGLSSFLT